MLFSWYLLRISRSNRTVPACFRNSRQNTAKGLCRIVKLKLFGRQRWSYQFETGNCSVCPKTGLMNINTWVLLSHTRIWCLKRFRFVLVGLFAFAVLLSVSRLLWVSNGACKNALPELWHDWFCETSAFLYLLFCLPSTMLIDVL